MAVKVVISEKMTSQELKKHKAGKNQRVALDGLWKEKYKSSSESASKQCKTPALSNSEDFQTGKGKVKHSDSYQSHSKTIRHTPASSERRKLKHFDLQ